MAAVEVPLVSVTSAVNGNGPQAPSKDNVSVQVEDSVDEQPAKPAFELEEHPIDQVRPIKVGLIGAGLTGITAGVLLPNKVPGLDLRIYDKNADVVSFSTAPDPFGVKSYANTECREGLGKRISCSPARAGG